MFAEAPVNDYLVRPDTNDRTLTRLVDGIDHEGNPIEAQVTEERPLTLFLNGQEIVTLMTIGDHPDCLAVGYLINQGMLENVDDVTAIEHEPEIETIVVRTRTHTNFEDKLKRKTRTSGCALGTVFGDLMEAIETVSLDPRATVRTSWLQTLTRQINTTPSLYLKAGAIHGCVLCEEDRALVYMEDVGRHNAVDKIAGYMALNDMSVAGKILYTTGRLTSEMVIKTARMGIPVLVSRSGFTAWGVDLARQVNMTLIGRLRGRRYIVISGSERVVRDSETTVEEVTA